MNIITVSCDHCSGVVEVLLPDGTMVEDFRTIEFPFDLGIISGIKGLSYDRKVRCPHCTSKIALKYAKKPLF